jgi:hypothetical protein
MFGSTIRRTVELLCNPLPERHSIMAAIRRPAPVRRSVAPVAPSLPVMPYAGTITVSLQTLNLEGVLQSIARNTGNRPIRAAKVKDYALAMLRGEWFFDLPTIVIQADDGSQHNGQHTRKAFVLAHKLAASAEYAAQPTTQDFLKKRLLVCEFTGVPREACQAIDTGIVRDATDQAAARDLISFEALADLVGSKGTAEQQQARFEVLKKAQSKLMQFSEALVWKRILGKLPRTNIGKLSGPIWRRSFEIFNGYTLPASEFALRCWKDAAYKVVEQVPDDKKPGSMKTKTKSVQPLSKRIGPEYLAAAHVLACSAAGLDGLECLQLVVDVLSSPLVNDTSAEIKLEGELANIVNDSPALQQFIELLNAIPRNAAGSHVGGSALADSKWVWLMRTLKCLIDDINEDVTIESSPDIIGPSHIGDAIRDAKTNKEGNEAAWALGGLDYRPAPDEVASYPHVLKSLSDYLAQYPEPDIYGDEQPAEPVPGEEQEFGEEPEQDPDDPMAVGDSMLDSLLDD